MDEFDREVWLTRPRWVATLSDGTEVSQDDGRPGTAGSAWLRLADRLLDTVSLRVVGLRLQFRDERPVRLPENAEGYFFRCSVGVLDFKLAFSFFLAGYLTNGKVVVRRYQLPELTLLGEEVRDPDDPEGVGPSLIRNPVG